MHRGGFVKVEREKSLERQMRAFHWVRLLAELPGRLAGSREEREAADRVEAWMREIGIEEISSQPVRGRLRPAWVAGLHLGLGAIACVLGGALGVVVAGVSAYSFSRELRARESLFSRWLPAAQSLNVIGRIGSNSPSQRATTAAAADQSRTSATAAGPRAARDEGVGSTRRAFQPARNSEKTQPGCRASS
jgi:hypothetical protein